MAALENPDLSLMSLEEELTCSICLSPFDCPVTLPCGHNFCQSCLLASWTQTYVCPQCRTEYPTKPELRKNTVLSTVVQTFNLRSCRSEQDLRVDEADEAAEEVVRCDTCMEAEAAQTCLTCMASFCEEHLRPHRENPVFRPHQLIEPVGDLQDRLCPDHHKLLEFFCSQHGRPICSVCLGQVHRGCSFTSLEEQKKLKESDLRGKLTLLHTKIVQNKNVLSKMGDIDNKLEVSASNRKKGLAQMYQQMHDMLNHEECVAVNTVDKELKGSQTKLKHLTRKFTENIENMSKTKEDINGLLSRSQTMAFLQGSFNMPAAVDFNPYTPRISLDSKEVLASETFAAILKERLGEMCKQPVEARQAGPSLCFFGTNQDPALSGIPGLMEFLKSSGPGPQHKGAENKTKQAKKPKPTADAKGKKNLARSTENLAEKTKVRGCPSPAENTPPIPSDPSFGAKKSDLMKYATTLTLDRRTAHKRIILGEECTKASVSEEHANYPNNPERFAICSQVLASTGFSRGRHYWEVRLSCNNFIGIGLAYGSIDRKGPASRLGRNAQSWCVEWFNVKLSAWHNSTETILANPSPKRVGVLLDCDGGMATFYNVTDRAYPFHHIVFPFTEAVYPAFWMFSSGSSLTLCKMQA